MGTKIQYISSLRNWVFFCVTIKEDPFALPTKPDLALFWLADRVHQSGNTNSIKQSQSMLLWLHEAAGIDPYFHTDNEYLKFKLSATKRFDKPSDSRLPLTIDHIIRYSLHYKCVIKYYNTIPLDDLLKVLIIQMYFCTMSRPSELLLSKYSLTKKGIKFKHLAFLKPDPSKPHRNFARIQIVSHKSMKSLKDSKLLYLGYSYCSDVYKTNKSCPCKIINPLRLLNVYLRRRKTLLASLPKGPQKNNLLLSSNNNIFVWNSGKIVTTTDYTKIIKNLVSINSKCIVEPKRYACYSSRIGGTTRASQVGIAHGRILKYVGWSDSKLPDVSMRYIRPDAINLSHFVLDLIHGPSHNNELIIKNRQFLQTGVVFDPWAKCIDRKFCFHKSKRR